MRSKQEQFKLEDELFPTREDGCRRFLSTHDLKIMDINFVYRNHDLYIGFDL